MKARQAAYGLSGFALVIVGASVFQSIAGPSQEDEFTAIAKGAVSARLLDPATADFRSLRLYDTSTSTYKRNILCGEVDAKNASGGQSGFRRFSAELFENGEWIVAIENSDPVEVIPFKAFGKKCFPNA